MSNSAHRPAASTRARLQCLGVAVGVCVMALPVPARADDPVMDWNDIARRLTVVPALAPVQQTRAMAIVHVAMHDAVNAITGEYERYHPVGSAPAGASVQATAIAAAHRALVGIVGDSAFLAASYATSLASHGISLSDPGLVFGESVATGILERRQNDGAAVAAFPYLPPDAGAPGVWTPISSAPAAQASDTRELVALGEELRLSPKALDLLLLLVRHRSRALSKAELQERLWPSTFVGETNLATLVAEIRRALRDTADDSAYVRTVHRFGYRFVADVAETAATRGDSPSETRMYLTTADRQFLLGEGAAEIGRSSDAAIRIDAAGVSRRHARSAVTRRAWKTLAARTAPTLRASPSRARAS